MKILNLLYPEKSDIKYRIDKFPDGQQQVIVDALSIDLFASNNKNYIIQIKSHLNNFQDLELIICATKSLRNLGVKEIHLYVPYFLGSRSDRQFEEGSNNYLKDVICPIINSLEFESVTVLDPHSDVLEACLNNFRKESNINLVYFTMNHLRPLGIADDYILVSPDAGASKKIYKLAEQIGYKGDIITCSKDRDENGNLTRTIVPYVFCKGENHPYNEKVYGKDIIIIDDICDGGATFINIATEIKKALPNVSWFKQYNHPIPKIYLIVTHGIFSKGFAELSKYFDGIYCTNSYKDIPEVSPFVKQLNVF